MGYYTIGYEIPQREYQFTCETGTARINLLEEGAITDYCCLYSGEEQKAYEESLGTACGYFERSNPVILEAGATVYVEECDAPIYIEGIGSTLPLKTHEAQKFGEAVTLEPWLEESREADKDFTAGVYDISLEDGDSY